MATDGVHGLVGNTPLVRLRSVERHERVRIWAKLEAHNPTGSMKDRVAVAMVQAVARRGPRSRERTLLVPTSGNTGIAIALFGALEGFDVTCVLPENCTPSRIDVLERFGSSLVFSPAATGSNGARETALHLARDDPSLLMLDQYTDGSNAVAHLTGTAAEIHRDLPGTTHVIAGLGSGGALTGIGRFFRSAAPHVKVVAVEPVPGQRVAGLRSLQDGFVPPVFDPSVVDSTIVVSSQEAEAGVTDLLERDGMWAGPSGGAVVAAARRVASNLEAGDVVCLVADGGWKYLTPSSTVADRVSSLARSGT